MDAALILGVWAGEGYRTLTEKIGVSRDVLFKRRDELGLPVNHKTGRPVGVIEWHTRA
jgi:hypothetical protein